MQRTVLYISSTIALLTFLLAASIEAEPNSGGYRGPDRNGIYPAEGLAKKWPEKGPELLWAYEELGDGWASATVVGDTVYCIGGAPTGSLFALDLDSGELKWKKEYGREFTARFNGTRSTPTVTDGMVIFSSGKKDERSIYCHDANSGEQVWHVDGNKRFGGKSQGWGYNESPLVVGDKVIFTLRSKDNKCPPVAALDIKTGKTAWEADPSPGDLSAGDCSVSLARVGKKTYVIANLWRAVLALDAETGERLWRMKISKGTSMTPVYNDGYLLMACKGGSNITMFKMSEDFRTYEELWTRQIDTLSQAVIVDGKVFGIGWPPRGDKKKKPGKQRAIVCFDADSGKLLKHVNCMATGSVVAADGLVFIVQGAEHHCKTPKMTLVKPTDDGFEITGEFQPKVGTKELWVSPTIARGRLFIRQGSQLAAYDISQPQKSK